MKALQNIVFFPKLKKKGNKMDQGQGSETGRNLLQGWQRNVQWKVASEVFKSKRRIQKETTLERSICLRPFSHNHAYKPEAYISSWSNVHYYIVWFHSVLNVLICPACSNKQNSTVYCLLAMICFYKAKIVKYKHLKSNY